jgi:hypothetical protein
MWFKLSAHSPLLFTVLCILVACWPAWVLMDGVMPRTHPGVTRIEIHSATVAAITWMGSCAGVSYWLHTRRLKRHIWSGQLSELLM